eukprot:1420320-Pyramimonas_sp.AAC.1
MELDPRWCCVAIVGDFNYGENAEVEGPLVPGGGRRAASHPRGRAWARALSAATEMIPHKPTHWHPGRQIATTIDKIWVGSPRWLLTQTHQHGQ